MSPHCPPHVPFKNFFNASLFFSLLWSPPPSKPSTSYKLSNCFNFSTTQHNTNSWFNSYCNSIIPTNITTTKILIKKTLVLLISPLHELVIISNVTFCSVTLYIKYQIFIYPLFLISPYSLLLYIYISTLLQQEFLVSKIPWDWQPSWDFGNLKVWILYTYIWKIKVFFFFFFWQLKELKSSMRHEQGIIGLGWWI